MKGKKWENLAKIGDWTWVYYRLPDPGVPVEIWDGAGAVEAARVADGWCTLPVDGQPAKRVQEEITYWRYTRALTPGVFA